MRLWNAPTSADATIRDLRRLSCKIENSDDRELVQHSADMLEIAMRQLSTGLPAEGSSRNRAFQWQGGTMSDLGRDDDCVRRDMEREIYRRSESEQHVPEYPSDDCRRCGCWSRATGCCKEKDGEALALAKAIMKEHKIFPQKWPENIRTLAEALIAAQSARAAIIEECAKVCDEYELKVSQACKNLGGDTYWRADGAADGAIELAKLIRALASTAKKEGKE